MNHNHTESAARAALMPAGLDQQGRYPTRGEPPRPMDFQAQQAEWRGARFRAFDAAWRQPLPRYDSLPLATRQAGDEPAAHNTPAAAMTRARFWLAYVVAVVASGLWLAYTLK